MSIDQHAEGRRARLGGVPIIDCPHTQDTEDYREWCAGWHGILNADEALGFGKTNVPEGIRAARAMLNLVRQHWKDIEEAKNVAALVMHVGETELYQAAPEFKSNSINQQTIALAMYASISKRCTNHVGKEGSVKLFQGAADYARLYNETTFFTDMKGQIRLGLAERMSRP